MKMHDELGFLGVWIAIAHSRREYPLLNQSQRFGP